MVDSFHEYYIGHSPPSEVYFIHMTFCELALLPSSYDWMSLYWKIYHFLNYSILNDTSWDQTSDLAGHFFRPPTKMLYNFP